MKPEIYRCLKLCKSCPFIDNGKTMHLRKGRMDSIKKSLLNGENFVCHETIYNKNTGPKDKRMCYGAYKFLKDKNKPNQIMQIAERLGVKNEHN